MSSKNCQLVCKPGSVWRNMHFAWQPFIWDDCYQPPLATYPNDTPGIWLQNEFARHSYSVLLPVGFTLPQPLLVMRWALTPPFHPYPLTGRFVFCGTFPRVAPAGRYPAPLFRGARTFLTSRLSALEKRGCPTN